MTKNSIFLTSKHGKELKNGGKEFRQVTQWLKTSVFALHCGIFHATNMESPSEIASFAVHQVYKVAWLP